MSAYIRRRGFPSNLADRATIRLMFPVMTDREGSPEFASDGPVFTVDLDDERFGPVEAREGGGISIKLLGQE